LAPDDARIAQLLLSTLIALGGTYRDQGRTDLSRAMLQRAVLLAQRLASQDPANDACARRLADAYLNLGFLHAVEQHLQQSEETYRQSLTIFENLARKKPADVGVQSLLAENRSWLASVLIKLNRHAQAAALLHEAREFQETLLRRHSVVVSDMTKLATTYWYLGHVHRDDGEHDQAIEWYGKAIALHDSVLKKEPKRDRSAMFLVGVLLEREECEQWLGRSQEAEADWQRALKLSRSRVWSHGVQRAERLVKSRDPERAELLVERLLGAGFTSGAELGRLARLYSLAATAAPQNEISAHAEQGNEKDRYASRAIELLRAARDSGWLDTPAYQRLLRTHADFQALHANAEFQSLLDSMPPP
jgi:tetratricopeptide (TPR) repeat protein